MAEETEFEKCNFRNFKGPVTLTLTLNWVIWHTVMHQSGNNPGLTSLARITYSEPVTYCDM